MKIETNELIELGFEDEYYVIQKVPFQGQEYLILVARETPVEVKIGKEYTEDNELGVEIIDDPDIIIGVIEELAKQRA